MKKSFLILFILFSTCLIIAFEPYQDGFLPKWLTEEEKGRLHEIDYEREQTDPPIQPPRNVAEYEPMSAVLIRYPLGIPVALVALMSEEIEVITIVASETVQGQAINAYQNNNVNMDNCSFLISETNSFWTRDYGPWFIFNGDHEIGIVDFEYDRPRPLDNAIPGIFAAENDINYYHMGLVHTGGDYMCDGMGIAASTNAAYSVNSGTYTPTEVDSIMQLYLGIDDYHVVPNIHGGLSHIDTWGKFLAPDKIMIREVAPSHPYHNHAEQAVAYFESQISSYGTPYKVYRVYTPNNEPYTNTLIANNRVFVPTTGSVWDDAAVQSFEQAMPGYSVYGVHYNYWGSTDALHCRVKDIADRGMLYIHHLPIIEDQQSYDDYEIQARIIPMSGEAVYADSIRVYYRIDDGDFAYEIMTPIGDYWYTAYVPQQEIGSEISYYINAADESGRNENHPYIGPYDPHIFHVIGPLVFLGAEVNDSLYGNDNGFFEPGETVEIIANYKNEGNQTIDNLHAQLHANSPFIAIHQPGQATHNSIVPQEEIELSFIVSASLASPNPYFAQFDLQVIADEDYNIYESFEIEVNAHVIAAYFITENFTQWLPEGWEVTSTSGQINWQQSNTNLAGGVAPEVRLHYNPSTVAVQRLITPSINTNGFSLATLEFKHLINDYQGGYTLKVETSGDGGNTWNEIMTFPDINMPATREEIIIDNDDVGSADFKISWTFDGDSWDINWWNIDDVVIGGVIVYDDLAFFAGEVSLSSVYGNVTEAFITAGDQVTYPNEEGAFSLAVLEGVYDLSVLLTGYAVVILEEIYIAAGDTLTVDFYLEYLNTPGNLTTIAGNGLVALSWDAPNERERARIRDTRGLREQAGRQDTISSRNLAGYNVYRDGVQINPVIVIDNFYEDADVINDVTYQYYTTAVYEGGESFPSNIVEATPSAEILATPVLSIFIIDGNVNINWEAVEGANSYIIYTTDDPYADNWEEIAIVGEPGHSEPLIEERKFYRVVASTEYPTVLRQTITH